MSNTHRIGIGIFVGLFSLSLASSNTEPSSQYINKTYIDTTIQRAFFTIASATDVAGMGPKMEQAIAQAKQTVLRFKNIAKDNPNAKYILWKIGELESQIYLEENGLLLEKQSKMQKEVNTLVNSFNAELAKKRPDFAVLDNIFSQIRALNAPVVSDMAQSLDSRKRGISREAVAFMERALDDKKFDEAQFELAYLKENADALNIPLSQMSMLEAKVSSKITVDNERDFIVSCSKKVEADIAQWRLEDARNGLAAIKDRVDGLKKKIMAKEWDKYFFRHKKLGDELAFKEDSLVKVNLSILAQDGVIAANAFLDTAVKKRDIAREKIGTIDLAILSRAMAARKYIDTNVVKQLASISPVSLQDSSTLMSDLVFAAKKKALAKADSGNTGHLTQAEEVRQRNMRLLAEGNKSRSEQIKKENEDRANKEMTEIYTLLEKKDYQKASQTYLDRQAFLCRYIPQAAFYTLDSTVNSKVSQAGKKKR